MVLASGGVVAVLSDGIVSVVVVSVGMVSLSLSGGVIGASGVQAKMPQTHNARMSAAVRPNLVIDFCSIFLGL